MVITPSDAYIRDSVAFTGVMAIAVKSAKQMDKLITIGITPTFPATGYGYIRYKKADKNAVKAVLEFKEKPNEKVAKQYLETGEYVWNSGMFIWKASTILNKYKQLIPDIYDKLEQIGNCMNTKQEQDIVKLVYPDIRKISVDYAILEPSAVNGDVWSDVGSWDMLEAMRDADENGNITIGDTEAINTKNSVIYSSDKLVAAVGVENLVIVETPDAIMVCRKNKAQDVRKIVEALNASDRRELL